MKREKEIREPRFALGTYCVLRGVVHHHSLTFHTLDASSLNTFPSAVSVASEQAGVRGVGGEGGGCVVKDGVCV